MRKIYSSRAEDPCVALIKDCFAVLKNDTLIAINQNGEMFDERVTVKENTYIPFKPFQWSKSIQQIGNNNNNF